MFHTTCWENHVGIISIPRRFHLLVRSTAEVSASTKRLSSATVAFSTKMALGSVASVSSPLSTMFWSPVPVSTVKDPKQNVSVHSAVPTNSTPTDSLQSANWPAGLYAASSPPPLVIPVITCCPTSPTSSLNNPQTFKTNPERHCF